MYDYTETKTTVKQSSPPPEKTSHHQSAQKSNSSGYGGSSNDPLDFLKEDTKHITKKPSASGSSGTGTLNTIPEGKIEDFTIPRPIWPYYKLKREEKSYDSLVDDALLLYTSLSFRPDSLDDRDDKQISVREVLLELVHGINATIEGKTGLTPEEMLRLVNEKLSQSVEVLKENSEKEVKNLCVNLSNCKKKNSVVRAFSNNSSSGNSSQGSPEWNGRSSSVETAYEIYHSPSGSSSSGFSDSQEFSGVRNAMIYGTLCRTKLVVKDRSVVTPKKSLLLTNDGKPSVWEQYYGMNASTVGGGEVKYVVKPTDVPLYVSIHFHCNMFDVKRWFWFDRGFSGDIENFLHTFILGDTQNAFLDLQRHFHFQHRLHGPLSYIQCQQNKFESKQSRFVVTVHYITSATDRADEVQAQLLLFNAITISATGCVIAKRHYDRWY